MVMQSLPSGSVPPVARRRGGRPAGTVATPGSAARLVEVLADRGLVHVRLGDGDHVGADRLLSGLALEGGGELVDGLLADRRRVLRDQDLEGARLERGDLVRFGVERGDLHRALLAGLLETGGYARTG